MTGFRHSAPFGATLEDGRTLFRLWAPGEETMTLAVEGVEPIPMVSVGRGWFEAEAPCGAGARYAFRLSDGLAVPDPASRLQADDVHGPSVVVDPLAYRWRHPDWKGRPWEETVIYELHVGACGGFRGIEQRLPALDRLGVTAIELMPIADFPGRRNWGYDGVLPFAPDTSYGSPEDLKRLVDAAHGRGLMVFLDVVYNHFGPDGNYLHRYAPHFFRDDVKTPWGPAIDFRRPEVRRFFTENALYWLMEYRFDGLRLDAVHAITEQDWLDEMAAVVRTTVEPGRHVHLVLENERNIASHLERGFDAQWNDDGHHALHVLLTGEREGYYQDYAKDPAAKLARCLKEGFVYQGEASAHGRGKPRGSPSAHLPPTAFVLFLQNHDQIGNRAFGERLTSLADPDALKAAAALVLMSPQIPLIFMGEEWGTRAPFLYFTDHGPELAEAVRQGRREEFASFPAFADPARRQGIPDPNDPATFARSVPHPGEAADSPHEAWQALYQHLLGVRLREIAPRLRGARALDAKVLGPAAVLAEWRMGDGALLTILANLGAETTAATPRTGRLVFESFPGALTALADGRLIGHCTIALLEGERGSEQARENGA